MQTIFVKNRDSLCRKNYVRWYFEFEGMLKYTQIIDSFFDFRTSKMDNDTLDSFSIAKVIFKHSFSYENKKI